MGKIIFSGMQPTGGKSAMHLGNYLGAMKQWLELQQQGTCYFCIVDLHALTVPQDPVALQKSIRYIAAQYIACGIDPEKCVIYQQSRVIEHAQLAWLLGCMTPIGWLKRMTQFKDKSRHQKEISLGLLSYPVLMAADILLFDTTHVPVGDDQKQHLELTRDIAMMFNSHFQQELFFLPEPIINGQMTRVMSLRDGNNKMSKSDPSDYSRINLCDDDDTIALKIRKAKTDPDPINADIKLMTARPEAMNLINIFASVCDTTPAQICAKYDGMNFCELKKELTQALIEIINPIRTKTIELLENPQLLDEYLNKGADKATQQAQNKLTHMYKLLGIGNQ